MLASNIPTKQSTVWASSATGSYVRTVPNTTADPNAASFALGFPPNTFVPIASGGEPPDGRDFNGALKALSAWAQWQAAGGPIKYDGTFSTAISGYPKGAVVQDATTLGTFWLCTSDSNTNAPGGSGWQNLFPQSITGNAGTATKWAGAITVTAGGEISGNVSFDGSANATFTMTYAPSNVNYSVTAGHVQIGSLVVNWARINGPITEQAYSVTWDLAFPNACLNVQCTIENSASTNVIDYWGQVVSFTASGATLYAQRPTSTGATASGMYVLAFGY